MSSTPGGKPEVVQTRAQNLRLVQITDCHIFADARECLRGMNTRDSLEAVNTAARAHAEPFDLVLATGDLSQDGSAESYRYLARQFACFDAPTFWIPGNHDEVAVMAEHFTGPGISSARHVFVGNWQIVLLDSTLAGEVHGRVADSELDFLDAALDLEPERHALVCLHHQAIEAGSAWIDDKGLREAERLRQRLRAHANVRAVLWGHVHQEAHHRIDGIDWMSTPSSCIQFASGSDEFALGPEAPGYRWLVLEADGGVASGVHRVDSFAPDAAS